MPARSEPKTVRKKKPVDPPEHGFGDQRDMSLIKGDDSEPESEPGELPEFKDQVRAYTHSERASEPQNSHRQPATAPEEPEANDMGGMIFAENVRVVTEEEEEWRQNKPHRDQTNCCNSRCVVIVLLIVTSVLLAIGGIVGGICGAGLCSSSTSSSTRDLPTPTSPPTIEDPTDNTSLPVIQNATEPSSTPPPTDPPVIPIATEPPTEPAVPTDPPVSLQARIDGIKSFINNITVSGATISYPPANNTAEELALQWLIEEDPLALTLDSAPNLFRLRQRYALLTLWFQSPVPWERSTYWLDSDECGWYGIFCEIRDLGGDLGSQNVVESLEFPESDQEGNNMHGSLPSDLFLMTELKNILMEKNPLAGTLPPSVGLLTELQKLRLYFQDHSGTLPDEIGKLTSLAELEISGNDFSGPIPSSVGQWEVLTEFWVSYNSLTGTLPESIGQWSELGVILVVSNQLNGTIPESVINWSKFRSGFFRENSFTGTMPFCSAGISVPNLEADCVEIECSCCSTCCTDGVFC